MPSPALAVVLLLLAASIAASQAKTKCLDSAASPPAAPAPPTSNTTNSSAFQANLLTLLNSLPQAAAPTGFASLSLGTGRDRAFVRGLCRGDTTPSECRASLQAGVLDSRGKCASNRSAASWYDKCYITYADTNATNNSDYEVRSLDVLMSDVPGNSARSSHEPEFFSLIDRLVARAASVGGAGQAKFATGEAGYAPNGTMYGHAECMRDLSGEECNRCLQFLLTPSPSCCNGYQGGTAQTFNCRLRVQAYAYYDLALDAPPPAAPPPGPISSLDNAGEGLNYISLQVLRAATSNFSINNKLGEGGFGEVFKGEMQDGMKIAVKRLSKDSGQGFGELKNELVLANKLKHKNLVLLLGVCLQEKLLVYEYMPNGSLDTIIFNSEKAHQLDWTKRSMIISGIARGLLYLHQESRLKVIHRDLKPSNVLLDLDMKPKISDFGLSRAFGGDQSMDVTKRPVGTLGYMSPEYAYHGQVSTKSDMYSFGVVVVEIVTGKKNNASLDNDTASRSLLSQVWEAWSAGSMEEVVDPSLGRHYPKSDVLKCVQIGLLCVQEDPSARPAAWEVVLMLDSPSMSMTMRTPSRPAFCFTQPGVSNPTLSYQTNQDAMTSHQLPTPVLDNEVTISDVEPR